MNLYSRDYLKLSDAETAEIERLRKENESRYGHLLFKPLSQREYPSAYRHHASLFPNNFIDQIEFFDNNDAHSEKIERFLTLLQNETTNESIIQTFIKKEEAYFIICSILRRHYHFGHHDLYCFPEFPLSTSYKIDYLIIGSSTGGYEFVFVELENPYGRIVLSDGSFGETIRKGVRQTEDWDIWLESNFNSLYQEFTKWSNKPEKIPSEFRDFDKSRIHFCVIAGRRNCFNKKTYRQRRNTLNNSQLLVLHYDNLIDYSRQVLSNRGF